MVTHPRERLLATGPRHIVSGPDRVVARVWSASRVRAVRYSIDDGPRSGLELSDDAHWQGRLPSDSLKKGEHSLEVAAVAADGTEGFSADRFSWRPDWPLHGHATSQPDRALDAVLLTL